MLTREQWENLARFAGLEISFASWPALRPWTPNYYSEHGREWKPDILWADFGPLFVLIVRWKSRADKRGFSACLLPAVNSFYDAVIRGTEQELMQAGCLLGAAIGATMTTERDNERK